MEPVQKVVRVMDRKEEKGAETGGRKRERCGPGCEDQEEGDQGGPERPQISGKGQGEPAGQEGDARETQILNNGRARAVIHGASRADSRRGELARFELF